MEGQHFNVKSYEIIDFQCGAPDRNATVLEQVRILECCKKLTGTSLLRSKFVNDSF